MTALPPLCIQRNVHREPRQGPQLRLNTDVKSSSKKKIELNLYGGVKKQAKSLNRR